MNNTNENIPIFCRLPRSIQIVVVDDDDDDYDDDDNVVNIQLYSSPFPSVT